MKNKETTYIISGLDPEIKEILYVDRLIWLKTRPVSLYLKMWSAFRFIHYVW